ncbi:MAG: MarC family protein [Myxococcota bacterium]
MTSFFELFAVALPAVFFVVDPVGVVPLFLAITAGDSSKKLHRTALRASVAGGGVLLFFALFGGVLFKWLGVSLSAFRVAGGLVLLMSSLDMLRARQSPTKTSEEETKEGVAKDDVALVPLGIPMLAGPGSIATVVVLMSKGKGWASPLAVFLAIALTFAATFFILRGATYVQRVLKRSGVAIIQRVMGLLLAAIAVQFVAEGVRDLLHLR